MLHTIKNTQSNTPLILWGTQNAGELLDGVASKIPYPQLTPLPSFTKVGQSCGLKADGSVWTWGLNYYGEMGTNVAPTQTQQEARCTGMECLGMLQV